MEAALEHMKLGKDDVVLDLGCGTGILFDYLKGKVKQVIGLDISSQVLRYAQKRGEKLGDTALVQADADHTPFPNRTFNVVFAVSLLQNMPDPLQTLREIRRVSKRDATIVVTALKKEFTAQSFKALLQEAKLYFYLVKTDNNVKGYIAVCKNKIPS